MAQKPRSETAGGLLPQNDGLAPDAPKQFAPDNVIVGTGNLEYRMASLMRRRKSASLAGQHRVVQRFDKELQLLRAAMGLDPDPPPETTRTHRNGKDPTNGENLMIATAEEPRKAKKRVAWKPKRSTASTDKIPVIKPKGNPADHADKFFVRLEGKKGHKVSTIQHGNHEDHAGLMAVRRMNKHEKHAEHGPFTVSSCKPMSKKAWHAALARRRERAAEFAPNDDGSETVFAEGMAAAQKGLGHNTNPHPYDSAKRQQWQDGHDKFHNIRPPDGYQFRPSTVFASDVEWARKVTMTNLASLMDHLREKGFEYASTKNGALVTHTWRGYRGPQAETWSVTLLNRDWATTASHNGSRLAVFSFTDSDDDVERGIPLQITASTWDGRLDVKTKQGYAAGWAQVLREVKR